MHPVDEEVILENRLRVPNLAELGIIGPSADGHWRTSAPPTTSWSMAASMHFLPVHPLSLLLYFCGKCSGVSSVSK